MGVLTSRPRACLIRSRETGDSGQGEFHGQEMTDIKTVVVKWERPSMWSRQHQGHQSK